MSSELFTIDGKRKYLNNSELDAFIEEANKLEAAEVRTFCLVMAYTGCRISEALALTTDSIDFSDSSIIFKTLKQRGAERHRSIPVPESVLDALELVHRIRKAQKGKKSPLNLWPFGRTTGWKHIKAVMLAAGIEGEQASPKGLRHGFGVRCADKTRNPALVKRWLGHRYLETTLIYMDIVGAEEREAAAKMWA